MKSLLSPSTVPPAVLEVVQGLQSGGFAAFLVGGCVRDALRGQTPKDFDVASSAHPAQVQKLFKRVIPTGIDHGTVTVVHKGVHVEVTTFRAETDYVDGRRPTKVEFHQDIEADLARRDFTINAMAWDPISGALVDPFGGQADLSTRTIRCVRDAVERFSEDGLRPLRAVRFATVLDFSLEPATQAAIPQTVAVFRKVAQERVHQEFVKLLLAPSATTGLQLLDACSLLNEFFPEADRSAFVSVGRATPVESIRLALLLLGVPTARDIVARLKFPIRVADEVGALVKHAKLPSLSDSDAQLRRWLAQVDAARVPSLLELQRALSALPHGLEERLQSILAQNPPLTAKQLALDGRAIMNALSVGPSAIIGEATRHLLGRVLDEPHLNTPDALRAELLRWRATLPQS